MRPGTSGERSFKGGEILTKLVRVHTRHHPCTTPNPCGCTTGTDRTAILGQSFLPSRQFQVLISLPFRVAFHLSLTLLVRYRSPRDKLALDGIYHPLQTGVPTSPTLEPIPVPLSFRSHVRGYHPLWRGIPAYLCCRDNVGLCSETTILAVRVAPAGFQAWATPRFARCY